MGPHDTPPPRTREEAALLAAELYPQYENMLRHWDTEARLKFGEMYRSHPPKGYFMGSLYELFVKVCQRHRPELGKLTTLFYGAHPLVHVFRTVVAVDRGAKGRRYELAQSRINDRSARRVKIRDRLEVEFAESVATLVEYDDREVEEGGGPPVELLDRCFRLTNLDREQVVGMFSRTLKESGEKRGVTKERIRQIRNKAVEKLRAAAERDPVCQEYLSCAPSP